MLVLFYIHFLNKNDTFLTDLPIVSIFFTAPLFSAIWMPWTICRMQLLQSANSARTSNKAPRENLERTKTVGVRLIEVLTVFQFQLTKPLSGRHQ